MPQEFSLPHDARARQHMLAALAAPAQSSDNQAKKKPAAAAATRPLKSGIAKRDAK